MLLLGAQIEPLFEAIMHRIGARFGVFGDRSLFGSDFPTAVSDLADRQDIDDAAFLQLTVYFSIATRQIAALVAAKDSDGSAVSGLRVGPGAGLTIRRVAQHIGADSHDDLGVITLIMCLSKPAAEQQLSFRRR